MEFKTVYETIIETRTGRPSDEEKMLIGELCMKYDTSNQIPRSRKYISIINDILDQINSCNDEDRRSLLELAKNRVSKCLKEYRNKSYYHYMDLIEPGVNKFIDKYYGVRPDDDVFVCIYLIFLRDKYKIEGELKNSEINESDIAYRYMKRIVSGQENIMLNVPVSELSKKDKAVYDDFKNKYSLIFDEMPFFNKDIILNNYFEKNNGI